jgi:signal transduction histidine kinase
MEPLYPPQSRAERLIAGGRVILAASALFAVWLDPTEPTKYAGTAYCLLAAYVVYAVVIAALVWRSDAPANRYRLIAHCFDLAFFSLFIYFTAGPASPFNAYFVFSLVCATLRWQWRGTLWTAVASLAIYLAVGLYFTVVVADPSFPSYPLIVRGVYLVVTAVLLGYLGAHEERTRRDMERILQESVATEERIRLARDLHDGVLQSLTGIGLRLAAVRGLLDENPPAAREAVKTLQDLIAREQSDLRFFIKELKPPPLARDGEGASLAGSVAELVRRMEMEWGLRAELRMQGLEGPIAEPLARDVYHVVREALVNAVRHGGASAVRLLIARSEGDSLSITVADNGRGFPFHGRYSHADLVRDNLGPRNLRERIVSLQGSLAIDSTAAGARLDIAIPSAEGVV